MNLGTDHQKSDGGRTFSACRIFFTQEFFSGRAVQISCKNFFGGGGGLWQMEGEIFYSTAAILSDPPVRSRRAYSTWGAWVHSPSLREFCKIGAFFGAIYSAGIFFFTSALHNFFQPLSLA